LRKGRYKMAIGIILVIAIISALVITWLVGWVITAHHIKQVQYINKRCNKGW
jgi:fucose permease